MDDDKDNRRRRGGYAAQRSSSSFFGLNEALLSCLWLVDIVLNSSIEFGDFPGERGASSSSSNTILTMCVARVAVAVWSLFVLSAGYYGCYVRAGCSRCCRSLRWSTSSRCSARRSSSEAASSTCSTPSSAPLSSCTRCTSYSQSSSGWRELYVNCGATIEARLVVYLSFVYALGCQNHLNSGAQLIEIWDMDGYPVLSCIQKLSTFAIKHAL